MNKVAAEKHKDLGNNYFRQVRYKEAIKEYTTAIIKDPSNGIYYTNRAQCYLKLQQYDEVIEDTRKAIDIPTATRPVKAYYLLGKALIEKKQHTEALNKLKIAYEEAIQQKVKYVNDILLTLLTARKRKWNDDEVTRLQNESELLQYVNGLVESERQKMLLEHSNGDAEMSDDINYQMDEQLSKIRAVFEHSEQNLVKREIPDAYIDKISFNIMVDPVFTPDGITYERQSLLQHFERNGETDPITGRSCSEKHLIPNRSLREAIEDFLKDNGWAADY